MKKENLVVSIGLLLIESMLIEVITLWINGMTRTLSNNQ